MLAQVFKALEIGCRQIAIGHGSRKLGARSVHRELEVLRIELRQRLACTHVLADVGHAAQQLAAHPKAQTRLGAGPHFGGVFIARANAVCSHDHHLDGAHGFFGGRGFAAGGQGGNSRNEGQAS